MTSHRDAITGQYVTAEHAAENPDTTVSEARTRRPASDHTELRRRAEACPMPDNDPDTLSEWYELEDLTGRTYPIPPIDAAFIVACSPTVALGLIARVAELEGLVEAECAGRMRLAEQVRAVRKLHHEVDVPALGPDCSAGECDHENDCPSVPTPVCDHCDAIGESASPYPFEEAPGLTEVLWPCKTIRILDGDTGDGDDDANSNSKAPLGVGLEPIAFDPPLTDDEAGAFLDAITTDEDDQ